MVVFDRQTFPRFTIGESLLPRNVFTPPRELTDVEREMIESHPLIGMRFILRHYGFDIAMVERAITSAEHHEGRREY